ncbi:hypothetical protein L6164_009510 [Bauhinia variegata]|uniref:Uncharacterized protein n=1 Tax=Bauhinia variegata TaxID=167791 RepID=A0ACB9PJW8_BAUVA|nr:hypothetical protein L6164_009510 [Bauhinia variegata]
MKFGEKFNVYLQEEPAWSVDKQFVHIEYKRLKKVLKSCQRCKVSHTSYNSDFPEEQLCSCPLCDQMFFSELMNEASAISGYFSARVRHLLRLHIAKGMQRYALCLRQCFKNDRQSLAQQGRMLIQYISMNAIAIRKILKKYDKKHSSARGKNFKARMQAAHTELLHSPWLIELGAFYENCNGPHGGCGQFSCDLNVTEAVMTLVLPDSIKIECDLTCAICLDIVFNPYALGCGHLFCKSCACSAASVMIFQGLKAANPDSKCPICREVGVYSQAVHMLELDLLLKRRCKEYWKMRLTDERAEMLKQSKEYWNLQTTYAIGM